MGAASGSPPPASVLTSLLNPGHHCSSAPQARKLSLIYRNSDTLCKANGQSQHILVGHRFYNLQTLEEHDYLSRTIQRDYQMNHCICSCPASCLSWAWLTTHANAPAHGHLFKPCIPSACLAGAVLCAALSTSCLFSPLCLPVEQQGERIPLSPLALGFEIRSWHTWLHSIAGNGKDVRWAEGSCFKLCTPGRQGLGLLLGTVLERAGCSGRKSKQCNWREIHLKKNSVHHLSRAHKPSLRVQSRA